MKHLWLINILMNKSFWRNKKITVTGGAGFLGRHLVDELKNLDVKEIFIPRSKTCDLRKPENCKVACKGKDIVIHLAGLVGGIGYNQRHPARMYHDNILIGTHIINEAYNAGVSKLVAIGTICSYPKFTQIPFKESDLWNGYPEDTNAPFGLAKKMLLVQSVAYREEYGFNSIFLLPVNMYGPGDKWNPNQSHVIPALIVKVLKAKKEKNPSITVWGSGKATREFLFVKDAAEGIILAAEKYNKKDPINLGSGQEISIKQLANLICQLYGYKGRIIFDTSKPDGQPRRLLDISKAKKEFGFMAKTKLINGLKETVNWYSKELA